MINAVYDACVLYSASLRDFLLWLGYVRAVRPLWSETIHEEWMRSLLRKRPGLLRTRLERTRQEMEAKFPHSLVTGFEKLVPSLQLPDPEDRHVLAVALHAEAEYLVTFNLNDFPKTILQPFGIEPVSPDEFVQRLIREKPHSVLEAARHHRLSLQRPPKTVDEYLATLDKQGLPKTVAFLREYHADI
jgi:predicted nucleic acid-binding protein